MTGDLKHQFMSIFPHGNSKDKESLYFEISMKYSESHRYYHNLTHISECLSQLQTLEISETDRMVIELAIWFHDVIYDPKSKTNEEESAEFFLKSSPGLGVDSETARRVASFIRATQAHVPVSKNDMALGYFLDIDLAILGAEEKRFLEYNRAIRKEFSWVSETIFVQKRKEILQTFLDRKTIYQTIIFQKRYESRARFNLQKVIEEGIVESIPL